MPQTSENNLLSFDRVTIEGNRKKTWNNLFEKWTQKYGSANEVAPHIGIDDDEPGATTRRRSLSRPDKNLPTNATKKRKPRPLIKRKRNSEPSALAVDFIKSKGVDSKRPARTKKSLNAGIAPENTVVFSNDAAVDNEENQHAVENGLSDGDIIATASEGATSRRRSLVSSIGKNPPATTTQKRIAKTPVEMEKKKKPSPEILKPNNSKTSKNATPVTPTRPRSSRISKTKNCCEKSPLKKSIHAAVDREENQQAPESEPSNENLNANACEGATPATSKRPRSTRIKKLIVDAAEKSSLGISNYAAVDEEATIQFLETEPSNENLLANASEGATPVKSKRPRSTRTRKLVAEASEKSSLGNSNDAAVDEETTIQFLETEPSNENLLANASEESSIKRNRLQNKKQKLVQQRNHKQTPNENPLTDDSESEIELIWEGTVKTGIEFVETPRGSVRRWLIEPYF